MKVSIIIPVYNVQDYIERCLESVVSQNYRDIEVILVDDASPDGSMLIAKKFYDRMAGQGMKTVCVKHELNRGLSAARNSGIEMATGDYLYFLDSDDELYDNNAISTLVKSANESKADVIMGNHYVHRTVNSYKSKYNERKLLKDDDLISAFVKGDIPIMAWNKLIGKSLFDNGLRFKEGILNEDELFSYHLLFLNPTVELAGETTYRYNHREGSIMNSFNIKRIESPIIVYEEASRMYRLMDGHDNRILQNLDHFAFKRYVDIMKSPTDIETKRNLYRRLRKAQRSIAGKGKMRYVYNAHIYLPFFLGFEVMKAISAQYIKSRHIK